jgi:hypothetical protein
MNNLRVITIVMLLILSDFKTAQAQGMAVFDASSYSQMAAQIDALARDYQKQLEQLDQLNRQRLAMTGTRGPAIFSMARSNKSCGNICPIHGKKRSILCRPAASPQALAAHKAFMPIF